MELLVATKNAGKVREIEAILAPLGVTLRTPLDFPDVPDAVEDGETFELNALKKAHHWARATGLATLADDSGLCVDALGGEPGVRSARWAPTVNKRNAKLLAALADVSDEARTARFVCVAAFLASPSVEITAEGQCEGRIHHEPRGDGGFGYDPLFWLDEHGATMAEVDPETKNRISHRARALEKLRPLLEQWAKSSVE